MVANFIALNYYEEPLYRVGFLFPTLCVSRANPFSSEDDYTDLFRIRILQSTLLAACE